MTAFELLLAAVGVGSGIISGLVILSFSKSPGLGAGAALAVWGTTAAVLAFDMTPVRTAVVMAAACAPFAAAAGIRAGRLENRKRADEARRTLAKLLPQGWNPQTGPEAGREAGPEGIPDDVNIIIDPGSHPEERVRTAMADCLAGRRGDTARVIAENIAARLQAQIDLGQRGDPRGPGQNSARDSKRTRRRKQGRKAGGADASAGQPKDPALRRGRRDGPPADEPGRGHGRGPRRGRGDRGIHRRSPRDLPGALGRAQDMRSPSGGPRSGSCRKARAYRPARRAVGQPCSTGQPSTPGPSRPPRWPGPWPSWRSTWPPGSTAGPAGPGSQRPPPWRSASSSAGRYS